MIAWRYSECGCSRGAADGSGRGSGVGVAGALSAAEVPDHDPWALLHRERSVSSLRREEPAAPSGIPRQTEPPGAGP